MSNSTGSLPPNATLYVKNIPNKIKKPEVKRLLYCLFATYGKILDVVASKVDGMRGQAFIVFQDLASSTAALRSLDGFIFYGKPLSIDYAQSKSKATLLLERGPEALFDPELLSQKKKSKTTFSSAGAELLGRERKRAREEAGTKAPVGDDSEEEEGDEEEEAENGAGREGKKIKIDEGKDEEEEEEMQMVDSDEEEEEVAQEAAASFGPPLPQEGSVANNLLFCADVPAEATDEMLGVLFQQYSGFKAVQLLPPKQGRTPPGAFAFVEFDSTNQAKAAKDGLHEFKLAPGKLLSVAFAKRAVG